MMYHKFKCSSSLKEESNLFITSAKTGSISPQTAVPALHLASKSKFSPSAIM